MNETQIQKLAEIQLLMEELFENNQKFKIIIYGTEAGSLSAEVLTNI